MTTLIWPASLPQLPLAAGYEEGVVDGVIRSPVQSGASKTRARWSRQRRTRSVSFQMTTAQKQTFDAFMDTTGGGALPFTWTDPVTGATTTVLMTANPTGPVFLAPNRWKVSFPVEVKP